MNKMKRRAADAKKGPVISGRMRHGVHIDI